MWQECISFYKCSKSLKIFSDLDLGVRHKIYLIKKDVTRIQFDTSLKFVGKKHKIGFSTWEKESGNQTIFCIDTQITYLFYPLMNCYQRPETKPNSMIKKRDIMHGTVAVGTCLYFKGPKRVVCQNHVPSLKNSSRNKVDDVVNLSQVKGAFIISS